MVHVYALVGIALIALSPIYVALASVSPATVTFFRCLYALPPLFLVWYWVRRRDRRPRAARWMALGSGLVLAVDMTTWHEAIALIGAGLATVLANTQVVFVGVFAWLFHKEKPTKFALALVPVVLAGVACISGLGRADAYGEAPIAGALLGVASGLLYASFLLTFRASNRALAPTAGPLLDATLGGAIGSLALGVIDPGFSLALEWPSHGYLLGLALGSQVMGWLIIAYALPRIPAFESSILMLLQPTLALVLAAALLGERISAVQALGIFLVIGGVATLTIRGATAMEPHQETLLKRGEA